MINACSSFTFKMFRIIPFLVQVHFLLYYLVDYSHSTPVDSVKPRLIDSLLQERIDKFVENVYLPAVGVTGCGLAIVQNDGELLYTKGYGYADHERGIPNGNETQFLLGSVSKSITAVVVAKTLHEYFPELDEAVLDTPIRELMPHANFTLIDRLRSEHATFRDLLSHKMCLPRDDFQMLTEPYESTAEMLYRQRYAEEGCGFRTKFMYNNHMVLMASDLIGQLINKNFVDHTEDFLKELGMHDSAFIKSTDDFSKMPNRAMPYYTSATKRHLINTDLVKRLIYTQAVGGLYVSPNDMVRFIRFQLNMGKIDGQQLVPENVMSWLSKPSNVYQSMKFKKSDSDGVVESYLAYGLGLLVGTYNSWEKISHNGYFPPYRTEMSWYPALKLGIFSSTHEAPNLVRNAALHAFIFEAVRGNENAENLTIEHLKQEKMKIQKDIQDKNRVLAKFLGHYKNLPGQNIYHNMSTLIGKYGHPVSGEVNVFLKYNVKTKRSELYVSHGKWAKGWLESIGGSVDDEDQENDEAFRVHWDTDIIQDYYAAGDMDPFGYVTISKEGVLKFLVKQAGQMVPLANFKKGVQSDIAHLDPIPWKLDRCEQTKN